MKLKEKFQRFWTLSKSRQGFTLVELIVVIAILAILAGVAIPVYNGYIKKAQTAADQTLLDSVNTSFVAALMENGYSQYDVKNAVLPLNANGTVSSPTLVKLDDDTNVTAKVKASFDFYFEGNENATFNTFKAIKFDTESAMFIESAVMTFSYNGVEVTIDPAAIQAYQGSNWNNLASGEVLSLVGNVSDMATAIDSDTFLTMLGDEDYLAASAAVLGWSADEYDSKFTAMLDEAGAAWLKENPEGDVEAYKETLGAQMTANNAILVAAKGAETTGSGIIELLTTDGGATAKQTIAANMGSDPSAGLSQAALAYGLYTSYMLEKDPDNFDVNAPMDFTAVLNTMDDTEFQAYLTEGNGQQDLDGYLAALGAISGNSGTGGIGTDVLVNGFDNTELVALLQQAMGK